MKAEDTIVMTRISDSRWAVRIGDKWNDELMPDEALYSAAVFVSCGEVQLWLKTDVEQAADRVRNELVCPVCQNDRITALMGRTGDLCEKCTAHATAEQEKKDFAIADRPHCDACDIAEPCGPSHHATCPEYVPF